MKRKVTCDWECIRRRKFSRCWILQLMSRLWNYHLWRAEGAEESNCLCEINAHQLCVVTPGAPKLNGIASPPALEPQKLNPLAFSLASSTQLYLFLFPPPLLSLPPPHPSSLPLSFSPSPSQSLPPSLSLSLSFILSLSLSLSVSPPLSPSVSLAISLSLSLFSSLPPFPSLSPSLFLFQSLPLSLTLSLSLISLSVSLC